MIPKFDVYHKDLHSSYISFEKYKLFLQNQPFNGYIKIDDSQTQCFFFIKEGTNIVSFWVSGHTVSVFDSSELPSILKHPFFISSYRSPQQVVDFFARCHTAQVILDNLSFDSIGFDKFLNQIESKKITGFLEAFRSGDPEKYIYFYGGKIFGYMNIKVKDGVFEKNLDKTQIQAALKNSIVKIYSLTAVSGSTLPSVSVAIDITKKQPSSDNRQISNHGQNDEKRISVLECYEEIFQMLEKNTDPSEFTSIWRTCALELSNKYLFLNPFAGEFNYDNNKIDLWERIDLKTATYAFDELINAIAKKANLPKDGIKAIKDNYLIQW